VRRRKSTLQWPTALRIHCYPKLAHCGTIDKGKNKHQNAKQQNMTLAVTGFDTMLQSQDMVKDILY